MQEVAFGVLIFWLHSISWFVVHKVSCNIRTDIHNTKNGEKDIIHNMYIKPRHRVHTRGHSLLLLVIQETMLGNIIFDHLVRQSKGEWYASTLLSQILDMKPCFAVIINLILLTLPSL